MKAILRLVTIAALFSIVVSNLLLRNFTAPNPTGRRYSSEMPLTTGDPIAIGNDAERILSNDLRAPNNNYPDQGQCICSSSLNYTPSSNQCRLCVVSIESSARYRKPDFVTSTYMADSKNWTGRELSYANLYGQIQDFVTGSKALRIPFWLYIPVNRVVDSRIVQLVESTSGGVVRYFTVPGYVDPVDRAAQTVFAVSLAALSTIGAGILLSHRVKKLRYIVLSSKPPRPPKQPTDPVNKAVRKTDAAEDFAQRSKEKRRQEIETEDSRDDLL